MNVKGPGIPRMVLVDLPGVISVSITKLSYKTVYVNLKAEYSTKSKKVNSIYLYVFS